MLIVNLLYSELGGLLFGEIFMQTWYLIFGVIRKLNYWDLLFREIFILNYGGLLFGETFILYFWGLLFVDNFILNWGCPVWRDMYTEFGGLSLLTEKYIYMYIEHGISCFIEKYLLILRSPVTINMYTDLDVSCF